MTVSPADSISKQLGQPVISPANLSDNSKIFSQKSDCVFKGVIPYLLHKICHVMLVPEPAKRVCELTFPIVTLPLIGEWDVASEFRMDPKQDWMKSTATAVYKYSVDGCAVEMDYTSDIMGMKYFGKLIETYDRKNKQYQAVWIDNMTARMSYTTGNKVADSTILFGTEKMPDGSEVISRVITYNETKTSFDWQIDMSNDGGKTFWINGRAKYTKKK